MTLVEMADLVCEKVNKTDSESLELCKKFIRRRYQLIYDSYLWKDSLDLVTISNNENAGTFGPTNAPILPRYIERVVAVREGGDTNLTVEEQSLFFKKDPALYGRVGTCSGFHQIRPYWWFEYHPSDELYFRAVSEADSGKSVSIKDENTGKRRTVDLNSTLTSSISLEDYVEPFITKEATSNSVIFFREQEGDEVEMASGETSLRYERIRLIDDPDEEVELLILGKRRLVNLDSDSDSPIIQNIDDAIIAHAQADMLEKARQYAKSAEKRREAVAQVAKAIDLETNQSARVVVICPASYHDINNGDDI